MNCKNCDYLVERYGFCTKAMIHVAKPTDHLSFQPPIKTNKIKLWILKLLRVI